MNSIERISHPSQTQLEVLVQLLEANPALAKGFLRNSCAKAKAAKEWETITISLNSIGGGAIKTGKKWMKESVPVLPESPILMTRTNQPSTLYYHPPRTLATYVIMATKIRKLPVIEGHVAKRNENGNTSTETAKIDIVWRNVTLIVLVHLAAIYGLYLYFFKCHWLTFFYTPLLVIISGIGLSAGFHRLWSHKAYKARTPLKIILLIFGTVGVQNHVFYWVRLHRAHHTYADTNADPHNANRGFFFSHIGWILTKPHPEAKAMVKAVDVSDLTSDPLLVFHRRYYAVLALLIGIIIPTYIPTLWGEPLWNAFFVSAIARHIFSLHITFSVNSIAHIWGNKPYDKNIAGMQSKTLYWMAFGEGGHNFHHTFPWDYKISEFGINNYNIPRLFIDFMASIGWAYDLKYVTNDMVQKRAHRTGDASFKSIERLLGI